MSQFWEKKVNLTSINLGKFNESNSEREKNQFQEKVMRHFWEKIMSQIQVPVSYHNGPSSS